MSDASGFVATVRSEFADLDVSTPALRRFGWLVGGVGLAIALGAAWRGGWTATPVAVVAGSLGAALVALGTAAPRALRGVYTAWMLGALALGFVMTRVILTLAFVLVFVPVGLLFRAIGRDVLAQRPDPDAETYWIARASGPASRERIERMY